MTTINLDDLGWNPALQYYLEQNDEPQSFAGRVCRLDRGRCRLLCAGGEETAGWNTPLSVVGEESVEGPAVGDWCVAARQADQVRLAALLPRRTCFARARASGGRAEQVIAANVDIAFVVLGLDGDFSLRRIERYLTLARHSGARPVVLLNKADLHPDAARLEALVTEATRVSPGVSVLALCAHTGEGLDALRLELSGGATGVFLGSSGVGKSTIINGLLGQAFLATAEVRQRDDTGRHTTTRRELFALPGGGVVIDTPGLREVGVMGQEQDLHEVFPDVMRHAQRCRFSDCGHQQEPGCAVRQAVEDGTLDGDRAEAYLGLLRELASADRRRSAFEQRAFERQTWGKIRKSLRDHPKYRGGQ